MYNIYLGAEYFATRFVFCMVTNMKFQIQNLKDGKSAETGRGKRRRH